MSRVTSTKKKRKISPSDNEVTIFFTKQDVILQPQFFIESLSDNNEADNNELSQFSVSKVG